MSERKKFEDNQPGMDQKRDVPNDDWQHTRESAQSGNQGGASYAPGSTTQGGSNYGQGSHQLGGDAYHQGDQKNEGSNYENEAGRFGQDSPINPASGEKDKDSKRAPEKGKLSEAREDIPHGQGAHVNEKESNAQEDYPGTGPTTGSSAEPEKDII